MKDSITTIHVPPSPLNAVFYTERGIRKKLCLLAGIQRANDDNTTAVFIEPMIYRDDKKAWYRAKEANGYLGVEFADHPADWSAHVHEFESQHSAMEQEAANIVHTIERERASLNSSPPQPVAPMRRVAPPDTLPDGSRWGGSQAPVKRISPPPPPEHPPLPQLKPEEVPAAPRLTEEQLRSRMFKW